MADYRLTLDTREELRLFFVVILRKLLLQYHHLRGKKAILAEFVGLVVMIRVRGDEISGFRYKITFRAAVCAGMFTIFQSGI